MPCNFTIFLNKFFICCNFTNFFLVLHIQILHQPIKLQQISLKNQHRLPFPDYLQMLLIILVKVLMILVLVMNNIPWVKTCPSAKIHRPRSFHCQQQQIRQGNFTDFFFKSYLEFFTYLYLFEFQLKLVKTS